MRWPDQRCPRVLSTLRPGMGRFLQAVWLGTQRDGPSSVVRADTSTAEPW
ncbi:MAG: hypothetical protein M5U01_36045 [Ardenticatenaceae bacterium]|nr:hypothetical protein [Ardenticatenaceae bacterium]